MSARAWVAAAALVGLVRGADADADDGHDGTTRHAPTVTVSAGAVLPLFRLYELPGPGAAVAVAWPLTPHVQAVASADLGALFTDGARRYLGSLGAGVRVALWARGPVWLQLGLGTTGYVERIGIALPDKMIRSTDTGAMVTVDLGLGVHVRGWEVAVAYDHVLRASPYYARYDGDEELPFAGTGMIWIGRRL